MERRRREMDAEERDYQERLARARKKEASMRKMLYGRAVKKQVRVKQRIDHAVHMWQKTSHAEQDEPADEDEFLPDDQHQDNINPKLRALMRR
jgi:chromosome transmission fidelity protein 1